MAELMRKNMDQSDIDAAVAAERAAAVAWLRSVAADYRRDQCADELEAEAEIAEDYATSIEAGDHMRSVTP